MEKNESKLFAFVGAVFVLLVVSILLVMSFSSDRINTLERELSGAAKIIVQLQFDVSELEGDLSEREMALSFFLGADRYQVFHSTVTVDLPVSYYRQAYISADLIREKGFYLGQWLEIENIGLVRVTGTAKGFKNTIRLKSQNDKNDRFNYTRKVSWIR